MDKSEPRSGYTDPADDPIPDDLTEEEKSAVRRQGEFLAWLRSLLDDTSGGG
ncbi:hypothetical protein SUDANB121_03094 [Nocardiopsis dassonvillei]|uniref:hypothetical protein n=1 Tax=Nocardiopsis dassonvillei TaxID=2014 RepID=UPI003F56D34A